MTKVVEEGNLKPGWMEEALERLLPQNLRENANLCQKIQDALAAAKISSEAELLKMTRAQMKAANVPIAARPYLLKHAEAPPESRTRTCEGGEEGTGGGLAGIGVGGELASSPVGDGKAAILASRIQSMRLDETSSEAEKGQSPSDLVSCKRANFAVSVSSGGDALHALVRAGDSAAIKQLYHKTPVAKWERALCSKDEQGETPLSLAIRLDQLAVVTELLERGASRSVFVHTDKSEELLFSLLGPKHLTWPLQNAFLSERRKALAIVDQALRRYITELAAGSITFAWSLAGDLNPPSLAGHTAPSGFSPGAQFTCFTSTKVQILTPEDARLQCAQLRWVRFRLLQTAWRRSLVLRTWSCWRTTARKSQ